MMLCEASCVLIGGRRSCGQLRLQGLVIQCPRHVFLAQTCGRDTVLHACGRTARARARKCEESDVARHIRTHTRCRRIRICLS